MISEIGKKFIKTSNASIVVICLIILFGFLTTESDCRNSLFPRNFANGFLFCSFMSIYKICIDLTNEGGYGLKIPVQYHFLGPKKATDWLKKKLETVEKELKCNVSKCLK